MNFILEQVEKLKQKGKYEEAISFINEKLKKEPTNKDLLFHIADIYYNKGEFEKAEKPLNFMLNSKDKNYNHQMVYYMKGIMEMEKTNFKNSEVYLKKSLELAGYDNPELLRAYGNILYFLGDIKDGIAYIKKAFSYNNLDARIVYDLVEINYREGQLEEAIKYINFFYNNYNTLETYGENKEDFEIEIKLFWDFITK